MKKFKVAWLEYHETVIEALDEDSAIDKAWVEDPELTKKNQTIEEITYKGESEPECMDIAHAESEK